MPQITKEEKHYKAEMFWNTESTRMQKDAETNCFLPTDSRCWPTLMHILSEVSVQNLHLEEVLHFCFDFTAITHNEQIILTCEFCFNIDLYVQMLLYCLSSMLKHALHTSNLINR